VVGRRVEEAAGKSEANRVPVKVEEEAAEGKALWHATADKHGTMLPRVMSDYPETVKKFSL
jgi:hypothetical protein